MKTVLAKFAFTADDWFTLGRSLLGEDLKIHAGLCFKAAAETDCRHIGALYNLAHCQEDLGLVSEAGRTLGIALKLAPQCEDARLKLIQVLLSQGLQTEAFQVLWDGRKYKTS